MEVRNKIWEEFKQAMANVICIRKYTSLQRQVNCIYHVFIAATAAIGTIVSAFNVNVSVYALGAIAIVSLVKAIFPQILQEEKELCELDRIMDDYNLFMNKLEELFFYLEKGQKTEDEIMDKLFRLKDDECQKQSQMNKLIRWIPGKMQKGIDQEVNLYINEVYFNIYNNGKQQSNQTTRDTQESNNASAS